MQNDLGAVVEEHSVRAVGQHVAQSIFRAEVNEFNDELSARLRLRLLDQLFMVDVQSARGLDLGKLRRLLLGGGLVSGCSVHHTATWGSGSILSVFDQVLLSLVNGLD